MTRLACYRNYREVMLVRVYENAVAMQMFELKEFKIVKKNARCVHRTRSKQKRNEEQCKRKEIEATKTRHPNELPFHMNRTILCISQVCSAASARSCTKRRELGCATHMVGPRRSRKHTLERVADPKPDVLSCLKRDLLDSFMRLSLFDGWRWKGT